MTFVAVAAKLKVNGFTKAQEDSIWADLEFAYAESATARKMFDDWIVVPGNTIEITYVPGVYRAYTIDTGGGVHVGAGEVEIDPAYLEDFSYITDDGKAVAHSQIGALLHELAHTLTGRQDNYKLSADYFMGDNVKFVNVMWDELGLPPEISYVAQSYDISSAKTNSLHRIGYDYTNGKVIDGAISADKGLITSGNTSDLLIGGPSRNILQSGGADDVLVGGGGNDVLNGGAGTDTTLLFGHPVDYDIRRVLDGTWVARHVRGAKDEGTDHLINVEKLRFGNQIFDLKAGGMTFQTDLALVIDTTGSMADSIDSVKRQADDLINALFDHGNVDARIAVVTFKDWEYGDPTTVRLPFTDNDNLDARRLEAFNALRGITADGGGPDVAETSFDGLWKAVNGDIGEWRVGAAVRRIVLFTDAPPKDQSMAPLVKSYAEKVGAVVESGSVLTGAGGSLATFELAIPGGAASSAGLALPDDGEPLPDFTPRDDPTEPDTTLATIEIYTIFSGPNVVDTQAFESLSHDTGGSFLTAAAGDDVATVLLSIIGGLDLVGTPDVDALTGGVHIDKLTGLEGDDVLDGGGNADTMFGGPGDDTYAVDHPKDSVVELPGEGTDAVTTTLAFHVLPDNVENGAAAGGADAILTGNDLANALVGGAGSDSLIGLAGDDVLQGGDEDDLLFGGRPSPGEGPGQLVLDVGAGNDSIGSAIDLMNLLSLAADPDILDATTVPHVSITGKGYGTLHYFAVMLDNIGDVLTVDVDRGKGANNFVSIVAPDASVLASGNDSATSQGAGGSTSTLDAFVQYTATAAGVHYIVVGRVTTKTGDPNVGDQWASILQPGDSYELQVSVDSAAPAGAFASGDDRLAGGLGVDVLVGGDGVDSFEGTPAELDGDRIGDYEAGEKIVVQGVAYGNVAVSWSKGSKVVGIDTTGDGVAEASVTLDVAPDDLILAGLQLMLLPAGDGGDTSIAFTTPPVGPVVSIAALSPEVAEGDSAATPFTLMVTLSQPSASVESVSWTVGGRSGTPADAADFAGAVMLSGIVTFAPGEATRTITVDIAGDTTAEGDEGFSVFLSDATSGLEMGVAIATGTILDDDGTVVAHGDAYVVRQGQALAAPLSFGVLANDESASTASLLSGPSHGTLQLVGNGTFTYTPDEQFSGIDTFTYQAGNSGPTMGEAQVALHVVPVQVGAATTLDLLALTAEEQIAATYAAFFGRAADMAGFDFWLGEFVGGLPAQGPAALFANIASSFGISDEAKGLYPFLAEPFGAGDSEITAFLESVYDNLFDRASDAAGLAYWTGQVEQTLQAGAFVGSVLVNIVSGAQDTAAGEDITTLMGKVSVSLAYVGEQREHGTVWSGAGDVAAATALLGAVTSDPASVLVGVRQAETLIAVHA